MGFRQFQDKRLRNGQVWGNQSVPQVKQVLNRNPKPKTGLGMLYEP